MVRPSKDYSELAQPRLFQYSPQTTKFLIVDAVQNPGPQIEWTSHGVTRRGLSEEKQRQLFEDLQDTCTKLEARGITTLCIDITDQSRLYRATDTKHESVLRSHRLEGLGRGRDIFFKRFMDTFTDIDDVLIPDTKLWANVVAENGGRKSFLKKFMHPNFDFAEIASIVRSPTLLKSVIGQRKDQKLFFAKMITGSLNKDDFFGIPTAIDYLRQSQIEHVVIAGAMAGYCVAGTAISAAMNGFKVTILSDRVVGWENRACVQVVRNQESPRQHSQEISERLDQIIRQPETAGYNRADIPALIEARKKIEMLDTSQFVEGLEALKTSQAETLNQNARMPLSNHVGEVGPSARRPVFYSENQSNGKFEPNK